MATLHMDQKKKLGKKEKKTPCHTNIKFQNKTFSAFEAFRGYIHLAKSLRCEKKIFLTMLKIDIL